MEQTCHQMPRLHHVASLLQTTTMSSVTSEEDYDLLLPSPGERKPRDAPPRRSKSWKRWRWQLTALAGISLILGSVSVVSLLGQPLWSRRDHVHICNRPVVRREWRALTPDERADFIDAIQCLNLLPSKWGFKGSTYDDFSLLHLKIGSWCMSIQSPSLRYSLRANKVYSPRACIVPSVA
ncbi:hypothetical protein CGRA01v4_09680 [Colletotrichum graminicola]|nr:hypothetical protein CGRA01v4_09680 [Colletotrichum graminicola]